MGYMGALLLPLVKERARFLSSVTTTMRSRARAAVSNMFEKTIAAAIQAAPSNFKTASPAPGTDLFTVAKIKHAAVRANNNA
jgi:hypothetical protein